MKQIQLSLLAFISSSMLLTAGGDISAFTPYVAEGNVTVQEAVKASTVKKDVLALPKKKATENLSPLYVGAGVVAAQYDSSCLSSVAGCDGIDKTAGFLLRGGYDYNQYIGLEARTIFTFIKDNGGKIQHYGAFVKPMYPVTEDFNLYGLLGLAKTKTSGSLRVTDVSGLAYGLGLEFDGLNNQIKGLGLFVDYEKLYYKSNAPKLDAMSVGLTYDF